MKRRELLEKINLLLIQNYLLNTKKKKNLENDPTVTYNIDRERLKKIFKLLDKILIGKIFKIFSKKYKTISNEYL